MDIIKDYNIKIKKLIETNDEYIIRLSKSRLSLQRVYVNESRIMAACAISDYIREKGFEYIISIKKSKEGRPYVKRGEEIYVLMDNVGERKFKLINKKNIEVMTNLLALFHNAAEGFIQPPGIKVNVSWGKRIEKCRVLLMHLEKYALKIKADRNNSFEEYTYKFVDYLIRRAKNSMSILSSNDYLEVLEESMKKREVCINSISNNTALVNGGNIIISRIFDMGYNMIEEDVASFIKKVIIETSNKNFLESIVEEYSLNRYIDEKSKRIIIALVNYPYDSIRTIGRYIKYPEDSEILLKKFKEYIAMENSTEVMGV